MKYWKGHWIIVIAMLHTAVAFVQFHEQYVEMIAAGLVNSIENLHQGVAVWFILFGILIFVSGLLILSLEKAEQNIPMPAIYALLVLAISGVVTMPVSGFWLLFPPVLAFMFQKK